MKRILLVDDSQYTLATLSDMLKKSGYEVKTCSSVEEATKEFSVDKFDLVITDIVMKDLAQDGTKLAQFVKQRKKDFPVLAITSGLEFDKETYIQYVNKFVDQTLIKGFSKDELIAAVKRLTP